MNAILQQSVKDGASYSSYVIPINPLFDDLQTEISNRNINPHRVGDMMLPVMMGIVQRGVDDFGCFRGYDLSEERYTTHLISEYLNYEDESRLVEQLQEHLTQTMYGTLPITIPEWQWYYKLLQGSHLVLYIDKRDTVCRPEEPSTPITSPPACSTA